MGVDIWTYRQQSDDAPDLIGYQVEALDGSIGKVDEASNAVGASYVVVDVGRWIFGKQVMLPAGVVSRVDIVNQKLYVDRTKEQVKNAPEFDSSRAEDRGFRGQLGSYYEAGGAGSEDS